MNQKTIGFALCGSFCTFKKAVDAVKELVAEGYNVIPIFSEIAYATDTRFGRARDWVGTMEALTGSDAIHTIVQAEPIGPKGMLDLLVIAPCTGNTLAKLAAGIADTCVTMTAKSHLRNQRPVLLAPSTNDALGSGGKNIGALLNYRNLYFVPLAQDDPAGKPRSMVSDFSLLLPAVKAALEGNQLQPILATS